MQDNARTHGWIKQDFVLWLMERGVSRRVAGNYVSRCKRVEREFNICLCDETVTREKFIFLMVEIHTYALRVSSTKEAAYSLTGALRLAVRKFADFNVGNQALLYPASYALTKYSSLESKVKCG